MRVVSDGGRATVVVVDGGAVVVVAAVELVVAAARDDVVDDAAAAPCDRLPLLPSHAAIETRATATTSAMRTPGREPARLGLIERS
jgi:hypothetical protein